MSETGSVTKMLEAEVLSGVRRRLLYLGCLAALVVVAFCDHSTGWELSFSIFYVMPVAACAWYGGRPAAVAMAVGAACGWLAIDYWSRNYSHPLIGLWNGAVRLGFFLSLALAIAKIRVYIADQRMLSRVDFLTGCLNSRAFHDALGQELARLDRTKQPVALAYVDLDNFKQVNDAEGHAKGDEVLRNIAAILKGGVRPYDVVARLGGDEFAVLLPATGQEEAEGIIERLRQGIDGEARGHNWPIGTSVGLVTYYTPESPEEAVRLADSLMYRVKRSGKDSLLSEAHGR